MHLGISLIAELILYHTKIIKLNFLTIIIKGKCLSYESYETVGPPLGGDIFQSGLHFTMMIWNKSNTYE